LFTPPSSHIIPSAFKESSFQKVSFCDKVEQEALRTVKKKSNCILIYRLISNWISKSSYSAASYLNRWYSRNWFIQYSNHKNGFVAYSNRVCLFELWYFAYGLKILEIGADIRKCIEMHVHEIPGKNETKPKIMIWESEIERILTRILLR
jgi:hypothetical protein